MPNRDGSPTSRGAGIRTRIDGFGDRPNSRYLTPLRTLDASRSALGSVCRLCDSAAGTERRVRNPQVCHHGIGAAFPQHGPGRKHLRRIELTDWQRELTYAYPAALIRGLIHSDGCRAVNCFKTKLPSGRVAQYQYVRYFFSNLSADIRQIFIDHCELLGIRVTQSNHRNLSVAHRHSVAILERIVGPKR